MIPRSVVSFALMAMFVAPGWSALAGSPEAPSAAPSPEAKAAFERARVLWEARERERLLWPGPAMTFNCQLKSDGVIADCKPTDPSANTAYLQSALLKINQTRLPTIVPERPGFSTNPPSLREASVRPGPAIVRVWRDGDVHVERVRKPSTDPIPADAPRRMQPGVKTPLKDDHGRVVGHAEYDAGYRRFRFYLDGVVEAHRPDGRVAAILNTDPASGALKVTTADVTGERGFVAWGDDDVLRFHPSNDISRKDIRMLAPVSGRFAPLRPLPAFPG